jgi:competence protein ComGC
VTICPCCGVRFEGNLREGCACGARSVGEPLPKPDHELPAYGRSLLLTLTGIAMVMGFLAQTILAMAKMGFSLSFWAWIAAAETASWRLKFVAIPVTFVVLWGGRRIYQSMLQMPSRFVGMKMARRGLIASAVVSLLIATLIGVTVPARLRQRQMAIDAGNLARAYTLIRAQQEYQAKHGTLPTELRDLYELAANDPAIFQALNEIDVASYQPRAEIAAAPTTKGRRLQGASIRNASVRSAPDEPAAGLGFINYDLRLPGPDKILQTDDDILIRDGLLIHDGVNTHASTAKDAPKSGSAAAGVGRQ